MNFVRLYIGDYLRDTGTLTVAEHGAYMLMLMHYYATEQPLPAGRELHRLLRAETKAERDAIDSIARKFWHQTECGLVNTRADREIERAERQRDVNREVGKLGGRPKRTETESVSESVSESEPNGNRPITLPPDTRHQTPKEKRARKRATPPPTRPPDVVERVWSDWLRLRDAKRAPVTETVVAEAVREAGKAGMTLEAFLSVWCSRGSQGLQADWLRPNERHGVGVQTFRERDAELAAARVHEMTGGLVAAKPVPIARRHDVLQEVFDAPRRLG